MWLPLPGLFAIAENRRIQRSTQKGWSRPGGRPRINPTWGPAVGRFHSGAAKLTPGVRFFSPALLHPFGLRMNNLNNDMEVGTAAPKEGTMSNRISGAVRAG